MQDSKSLPTILLVHYGDNWIRGSERCLLDLIANIDRSKFNIILWCNSTRVANDALSLGVKVIVTDFTCLFKDTLFSRITNYFRIVNIANYIISKYNVTLVHGNSAAPSLWLNRLCRKIDIPLVSHLHSLYTLKDRILFGLHRSTIIVGVSQYVLEGLFKDGIPDTRLKVINNGLDIRRLLSQKKINIRKELKLSQEDYLIATTGSLIDRKGIEQAISAIVNLRKIGIPVHLLILGEGPLRKKLENIIIANSASSYIHLRGESDNIVGTLRGGVNLFISTAKEEAFGLSIAEASLSSIPVIAPQFGEISNIVRDNVTGMLYPRCDETILIEKIEFLYHNSTVGRKMGICGFDHIISNFDIKPHAENFEHLYDSIISNKAELTSSPIAYISPNIVRSIGHSLIRVVKNIIRPGTTS